jgi:hypothetical protein
MGLEHLLWGVVIKHSEERVCIAVEPVESLSQMAPAEHGLRRLISLFTSLQ